jgi:D-alanyl-D-alanine carboxypeptidase/D-alanyl-D-alanine-endopeptidase (penicillin-binding protein 4)
MKKQFLIVFILFHSLWSIKAQLKQDSLINDFLNHEHIKNSLVGIELLDARSSKVLIKYQSNKLLVPASVQKLFSSSYALKHLGLDYKFKTFVYTNGEIEKSNQNLNGDLIISLSGDPSLESRYFDSLSFLDNLFLSMKELNIKTINGEVILIPNINDYQVNNEWLWGDIGNYYGAGYSSHTFRDNYVDVFFNSSKKLGDTTFVKEFVPFSDNFSIINSVFGSSVKNDFSNALGAPYQNQRKMIGEIPANKNNYKVKISMDDPKVFLRDAILTLFNENGIDINQSEDKKSNLKDTILAYESPNLNELLKVINFKSNNNYAEHLLMKSVQLIDSSTSLSKAPQILQKFWEEKLNIQGDILFSDGCGLSRKNLTSAHTINKLLLYILSDFPLNLRNVFLSSLPVYGESGTLKYIGRGTTLEGKFKGKSGSMGGVRCYSGYFIKSNIHYPFTIMVNNFLCEDSEIRSLIKKLMIDIYQRI